MRSEKPEFGDIEPKPRYWDRLSKDDKASYAKLREALSSPACKNRRNKSIATFAEIVDAIHQFVEQGDEGDNIRALVCGITWIDDGVAINTHQLRLLISKCKSSINGSFQAMGYGTIPTASDSAGQIISKFPFLKNNFPELRQWTVRKLVTESDIAKLSEVVSIKRDEKPIKVAHITPPGNLAASAALNEVSLIIKNVPDTLDPKFETEPGPSVKALLSSRLSDEDVDISPSKEDLVIDEFSPMREPEEDPFSFSFTKWGDNEDELSFVDFGKMW